MKTYIRPDEQARRQQLVDSTRRLILETLPVEEANEAGLLIQYEDYYLQIVFSELHPLMVITFIRNVEMPQPHLLRRVNEINIRSILGCHMVNQDVGFYSFRAAHWLEAELTKARFLELLDRCFDEVCSAYGQIHSPQ